MPDGSCGFLKDNRCSIYEDRPNVCRINYMIERTAREFKLDRRDLYNYTVQLCNAFQQEDGMPDTYRLEKI